MLDYYQVAKEASMKIGGHPGLMYLHQQCQSAEKILDAGCGEGSRLHTLLPNNKSGWGIDINTQAIKHAKKQYPKLVFTLSDPLRFPHPDRSFDLVYSAFVLEHT